MTLLLLAGLGACDRQSPGAGQDQANSSAQVPPTSGEAPREGGTAPQSGKGDFSYTLDRSKAGSAAPDFAFAGPDGKDATLQDFSGNPVLVNLWATWCGPCVAEMPTLDTVAKAYADKGLAVLTISQDAQGETAVKPFFAKHALPHLKSFIDPENQFGFHYATGMLPTTVLYDREGKEMLRVVGAMDWNSKEGRDLIEDSLKS